MGEEGDKKCWPTSQTHFDLLPNLPKFPPLGNAYQIAKENFRPLPKWRIPNKAATAIALVMLIPKSGSNAPRNRSSYEFDTRPKKIIFLTWYKKRWKCDWGSHLHKITRTVMGPTICKWIASIFFKSDLTNAGKKCHNCIIQWL